MKAIIAVNNLGFIGKDNTIPWHSKDDFKHFKYLTMGCRLLVGRKTFASLPVLKGRDIIIVGQGLSLNDALTRNPDWCIGGKMLYETSCREFTELHISHINDDTIGDTVFPNLKYLNPQCKIFNYHFEVSK